MSKGKIIGVSAVSLVILFFAYFGLGLNVLAMNYYETTELSVTNDRLYMSGEINSKTPEQFYKIFEQHPKIHTIIMRDVPGSVDDEANLEVAAWIAKKGLTIMLLKDSHIASGGTDFFLAGKERIVNAGALIGVHSWASLDGEVATDFPRDHEDHQPYIEFYKKTGMSQKEAEDFYFFTINAAPADDILYMSLAEIEKYKVATKINE